MLLCNFVSTDGNNYKAALVPQRIRETIHGWGKAARKRRRHKFFADDSTIHTDTSTVLSVEEYQDQVFDSPHGGPHSGTEIELQPPTYITTGQSPTANENSSRIGTLLRPSGSIPSPPLPNSPPGVIERSSSMSSRRMKKDSDEYR